MRWCHLLQSNDASHGLTHQATDPSAFGNENPQPIFCLHIKPGSWNDHYASTAAPRLIVSDAGLWY